MLHLRKILHLYKDTPCCSYRINSLLLCIDMDKSIILTIITKLLNTSSIERQWEKPQDTVDRNKKCDLHVFYL